MEQGLHGVKDPLDGFNFIFFFRFFSFCTSEFTLENMSHFFHCDHDSLDKQHHILLQAAQSGVTNGPNLVAMVML